MYKFETEMFPGEYWYGFCVADGCRFPLHEASVYEESIEPNMSANQAAPLLLSSKGRYIWNESGFALSAKDGKISAVSAKSPISLSEGHSGLRGAYLDAVQKHFPPSGQCPPEIFFKVPQYSTWIEFIYEQSQEKVLSYAQAILNNGYPPGILMIDDCWMDDYGRWDFHRGRFPDPKGLVSELHKMGFKVMLWTCPFISPDGEVFLKLKQKGLLLKEAEGRTSVCEWWNGHSAVLDFSNPQAADWYNEQNRALIDNYGIDGFKFDAGDGKYYPDDGNGQTMRWLEIGLNYPYNEYRAGFRLGGKPLVHRLSDKNHSWDENGVGALIPNQLAQGILGYSYGCPDMIGGGEYEHFTKNSANLDEELFIRYAQCAALMPMMQFSATPWRVLSKEAADLCREAAKLHESFGEEILALAQNAAKTGEPITRYMEYQFPDQGMAQVNDQFMLGERILAAPVWQKGKRERKVYLPEGVWEYAEGKKYLGGGVIEVAAPVEKLPYFILREGRA